MLTKRKIISFIGLFVFSIDRFAFSVQKDGYQQIRFFDGLAYRRTMLEKEYYAGFINKSSEYVYIIKKSGL